MWSTDVLARVGPVLLACAALSGCAADLTTRDPIAGATPITPTEQYSIEVRQSADQLALAPHADGLSINQRDAVAAFANRWRESNRADIAIRTPADADPQAVQRMVADVTGALQALGVPPQQLRIGPYEAGAPGGPILASFIRPEATIPNCETGWDNLTSSGDNRPSTHFGCATTANFAVMVADPRDLITPAAGQPSDASRRQQVLERYRAGAATSSARDDQASGSTSGQ